MSEFEAEVKKAEKELQQGLAPVKGDKAGTDEFLGDVKMQVEDYGQKVQDAASKAYDFPMETDHWKQPMPVIGNDPKLKQLQPLLTVPAQLRQTLSGSVT